MDPDGGNGEITPEDVTFIQSLYSLAPGTFVGLGERTRIALARSGRRSVTIVDPVRR
jgi:alpha-D-ribose 1-methylphosphonate 5-triphosphate synthase subunit PhnL